MERWPPGAGSTRAGVACELPVDLLEPLLAFCWDKQFERPLSCLIHVHLCVCVYKSARVYVHERV